MAVGDTSVGTGATITFVSSIYEAELLSVENSDISRPSIPTSHMGSTVQTSVPGTLVDWGSIRCTWYFAADALPPIDAAPEQINILLSDGSTWGYTDAYMTDFSWSSEMEAIMTCECTIKASALTTVT